MSLTILPEAPAALFTSCSSSRLLPPRLYRPIRLRACARAGAGATTEFPIIPFLKPPPAPAPLPASVPRSFALLR